VLRFLLLLLLVMLVARSMWRLVSGIVDGASSRGGARGGPPERSVRMVQDPVCGTFVVPSKALTSGSGDAIRYFCSQDCRQRFHAR